MDSMKEQEQISPAEETVIPPTDYIPVLMYHHFAIRDMGEGNGVVTTQAELRAQIASLKEAGYEFISLETLDRLLQQMEKKRNQKTDNEGKSLGLGQKYVCITIDDGYLSNYELAFPLFKEYRVPASIFVVTDSITQQTGLKKFTWKQGQKMVDSGMVKLYNHTANHIPIDMEIEEAFLLAVAQGEQALQAHLRQEGCKALAYPNGRFTLYAQKELEKMGFDLLFTVEHGVITKQTSRYEIPRIAVESGWDGQALLEHIERAARKSFVPGKR